MCIRDSPNAVPQTARNPDNPDQRIQEDINSFTSYTISLSMGLLNAVVTLASFVGILWGLSGSFAFTLGDTGFNIPGFMVWMAAVSYTHLDVYKRQVSGMRVFRSAQHYGLAIERGSFTRGQAPWRYLKPLHANLFLSAHLSDVRAALAAGVPAAQVYPCLLYTSRCV